MLVGLLVVVVAASTNPAVGSPATHTIGSAPENPAAAIVAPIADAVTGTALGRIESETAQDLHSEDIAVDILLDVRNVDNDVVGILFGGGKVGADATGHMRLEFRAVGMHRLDEALRASTGDANATVQGTFGIPLNRTALTAEEIRLVGAGQLLAAFQESQALAAKRYLQDTVPGLAVLDLTATWSNTIPLDRVRSTASPGPDALPDAAAIAPWSTVPPLREPPLVLDATARLHYVDRVGLFDLLDAAATDSDDGGMQQRIEDAQADAVADRSAFSMLGLNQLLAFALPPGWRLNLTMTVPAGFTVEGATDELTLHPGHRMVTYRLDGDARSTPSSQAAIVAVSNRFVVTTTLLVAVLLAGFLLRLPTEAAVMRWTYWRSRRDGQASQRTHLADRVRARMPWRRGRPDRHVR